MITTSAGAAQLSTMFNTCEQINPNVMGNWMGTVQYNRYSYHPGVMNVSELCEVMEQSSAALANYVQVSNMFLAMQNQSCLDISYKNAVQSLSNLTDFSGGRSWTYQTCIQTGYFQTTDSPTQPFGSLVPLRYYTQLCTDLFGLNMTNLPRIAETNNAYGGQSVVGATRIMFINCNWDEWASLSIVKSQSPSILATVIRNGAHCCDMRVGSTNPLVGVAQTQISHQLGTWLKAKDL